LKLPWRAQPLFAKILEIDPENFRARGKLTAAGSFDPRQPTGPLAPRHLHNRTMRSLSQSGPPSFPRKSTGMPPK
jgi:hypothetical protein